ncbi:MAG TPA: cytochrome b N-terminal domain-containing protein [bacterium]
MAIPAWIERRLPLTEALERHVTRHLEPPNLNSWWNFGSLAGLFLVLQIVTGVFLAMHYKPDTGLAFDSVQHIMREVNYGWLLRYLHALGASGFFLAVYLHVGRALYYGSYKSPRELVWLVGFAIFLCLMAEAFMGYLLPWGQMSFWSATVITNIFGTIPLVGPGLVVWLRGDFAVGDATLGRFFALHTAVLPVALIGGLVLLHVMALHRVGSGNPDGVDLDEGDPRRIPFWPYYVTRDLWFDALALLPFAAVVFFAPTLLLEPANWEPANPLATPAHLVPEWYFVPFYAILRSIPSKLGGAVAMAAAIFLVPALPWLDRSPVRSARYRPLKRALTLAFFANFLILGYLGSQLPVGAVLTLERISTAVYFLYFAALPLLPRFERARPLPGGTP